MLDKELDKELKCLIKLKGLYSILILVNNFLNLFLFILLFCSVITLFSL